MIPTIDSAKKIRNDVDSMKSIMDACIFYIILGEGKTKSASSIKSNSKNAKHTAQNRKLTSVV